MNPIITLHAINATDALEHFANNHVVIGVLLMAAGLCFIVDYFKRK